MSNIEPQQVGAQWENTTTRKDEVWYALKLREYGFAPIALHIPKFKNGVAVGCSCHRGEACPPKNWGKHPINNGWQAQQNLFLDPKEIEREFGNRWKGANIGCATGLVVGLVIIDKDVGEKQGEKTLAELEKTYGELPPTPTVITGSDGCHYYFRNWHFDFQNSVEKLGPGIDIRGHGGQGVLPWSVHKSGNRYRWAPGRKPSEVKIAQLPPAWVSLLLAKSGIHTEEKTRAHKGKRRAVTPVRPLTPEEEVKVGLGKLVLANFLDHPFIVWALEHPNEVGREAWRGIATNIGVVCVEHPSLESYALELFHELSKGYSGYSRWETESVFFDALKSAESHGPVTFKHMQDDGVPPKVCVGGTCLVQAARLM